MPSVSVVIPAYNCAAYLPTAIESVLAQTFHDLEVIVVDDGSSDDSSEVVKPYLDRIRYIRQPIKGLPGARNTGIRASTGEFIALLDADDAWRPEKLAVQMPRFADPEVGIVYSDFSVTYSDGRFLESYLKDRPLASEGYVIESYIRSRFLFPSAMVLRRSALEGCGLFDEDMLAAEDIELFARICLRWKVARVDSPLMLRTEGAHNITANGKKMSDYTILAFRKILDREKVLPRSVRKVIDEELGRQYWWRGYRRFKAGEAAESREDFVRSVQHDVKNLKRCAGFFLASFFPDALLRRLGTDVRKASVSSAAR